MPSQWNGQPGNESLHAILNISASTNATPIVVTTSAPHDYTEGDAVSIRDHATNTAANGEWQVHVVDASNIALYSVVSSGGLSGPSVGNGVGGATGTVRGLGLLATYAIPSDGDDPTAASVNVGLSGLGDRTQYLAQYIGAYKTIYAASRGTDSSAYASNGWLKQSNAINVWTRALDDGTFGGGSADFFQSTMAVPHVQTNDVVELEFTTTSVDTTVAGHGAMFFALGYELFEEGTSQTNTVTKIAGTAAQLVADSTNPSGQGGLILRARLVINTGVNRFKKLQAYVVARPLQTVGGPFAYQFDDDRQWSARILRPTGLVV